LYKSILIPSPLHYVGVKLKQKKQSFFPLNAKGKEAFGRVAV
jgi:hypothetical protein